VADNAHCQGHKMNELIALEKIAHWEKLKGMVLDSVSSPITKRVYNMALNEFMGWFQQAPRPGFTKATVSAWRVSLEERRLGSSSIIIRMSAIRKLAAEAADNGLLAPELAQGISRVKSVKSTGIRVGNWWFRDRSPNFGNCTVHRRAQRRRRALVGDAFDDHRDIAHRSAHESALPWKRRRRALPHDPKIASTVTLSPREVVMVMNFLDHCGSEDSRNASAYPIPPRIGVAAAETHPVKVFRTEMRIDG
jgi:hypothetical protein